MGGYPPGHPLHGMPMPQGGGFPPGHPMHDPNSCWDPNSPNPMAMIDFSSYDPSNYMLYDPNSPDAGKAGKLSIEEAKKRSSRILEYHLTEGLSSPSRIRLKWCNACQAYVRGELFGKERHNRLNFCPAIHNHPLKSPTPMERHTTPSLYSAGHVDIHNRPKTPQPDFLFP